MNPKPQALVRACTCHSQTPARPPGPSLGPLQTQPSCSPPQPDLLEAQVWRGQPTFTDLLGLLCNLYKNKNTPANPGVLHQRAPINSCCLVSLGFPASSLPTTHASRMSWASAHLGLYLRAFAHAASSTWNILSLPLDGTLESLTHSTYSY